MNIKKNISKLLLLSAFLLPLALSSCKDDGAAEDIDTGPISTIVIDSPSVGNTFMNGDTIWIRGSISASQEIHGLELEVYNSSTDSAVFFAEEHVHTSPTTFNKYWVNDVKGHSDMKLTVSAIIDHEGTAETKTVMFHCHPKM